LRMTYFVPHLALYRINVLPSLIVFSMKYCICIDFVVSKVKTHYKLTFYILFLQENNWIFSLSGCFCTKKELLTKQLSVYFYCFIIL
jgi:hypothetical protein